MAGLYLWSARGQTITWLLSTKRLCRTEQMKGGKDLGIKTTVENHERTNEQFNTHHHSRL